MNFYSNRRTCLTQVHKSIHAAFILEYENMKEILHLTKEGFYGFPESTEFPSHYEIICLSSILNSRLDVTSPK